MDNTAKQQELQVLSKRIRQAREDARLSQKALAQSIGVSDKSVSAYEKGRSVPPFGKLKKIAQSTNRPLTYFTAEQTDEIMILNKLTLIEQELEEVRKLLQNSRK